MNSIETNVQKHMTEVPSVVSRTFLVSNEEEFTYIYQYMFQMVHMNMVHGIFEVWSEVLLIKGL